MTTPVSVNASGVARVALDDKYTLAKGRVYMTAVQALVRLPMLQRERDRLAGRNTAGFVSGYRGSPLGSVDLAFWEAARHLEPHDVHFQPGINEDLAATAVWGSQQVHLNPARVDGVFAMWYGKAPGVDRSLDALRHANAAGTSPAGGVLAVFGDDHGAKSSTLPSQSEQVMAACMIPILYPANVQEYLDFGLHGWALSRYSGLWVGFKCVTDVVESSASVEIDPARVQPREPADFAMPAGGLGLRWPDTPAQQEARLIDHRLAAAQAYVRANGLDRVVMDSAHARLGIICAGKAYLDVREALDLLGIDDAAAQRLGIRVYKLGMTWPVEPTGLHAFAQGLDEVLVVEEKRAFIETQVKEILYDLPGARPRVVGKFEPAAGVQPTCREWLLDAKLELTPARIAHVLLGRLENILRTGEAVALRERLAPAHLQEKASAGALLDQRIPYFCSGCPHNTSTVVPDGSRAIAGIGCHGMVTWMDRKTTTWTHMGAEGVVWIGQSRFSKDKHVFANLGDGTYFHSGLLAIRAAVSAKVAITYKILFNDAVAMTGGQPFDGPLDVPTITRQVAAEGVCRIVVVTDEPDKYEGAPKAAFAPGVDVYHRDKLDTVQRALREFEGVSVLVYDQTCAAEKRRRRKRGEFPDPPRRVVINDLVCEGCGDCSAQSNCLSIEPLETQLGTKRTINQSSCNKDFSCVKGFCPSFVTVEGGRLRKPTPVAAAGADPAAGLPAPHVAARAHGAHEILITGVGGTGVVTASALLGMAAHIEGKGVTVMDMTGTAQKGGAVMSHVRIAATPSSLYGARVRTADLLIGGDLIVSASAPALGCLRPGRSRVVLNTASAPTAALVRNPDWRFPGAEAQRTVQAVLGDAEQLQCIDARALAVALLGDAIYANQLMLGFALQKGWLPVGLQALERAIELNGAAVERNLQALAWGRRAAHDLDAVLQAAAPRSPTQTAQPQDLDTLVASRVAFLTGYQDGAYGARYRSIVATAAQAEARAGGGTELAHAVAVQAFRLMAYKDEYEVARLHTDGSLRRQLAEQFEGDYSLRFHLAPPVLSRPVAQGAPPAKRVFGAWMEHAMRLLARFKFVRGTAFDPFGYTQERRAERELVGDYERLVAQVAAGLTPARLPAAIELAGWTALVRGYGHVKAANLQAARARQQELPLRWDVAGEATSRPEQVETAPAA